MTHITISYRRSDSDAIAGRIRDRLASHFGDESVFMDIDSIPFGFDFRDHIQEALAQNDILIAVIGPQWLGPGKGGSLRIMDETDPVRIEIETALKNGSAIIPVLVGGAVMPEPADLPESLKNLAFRNAAQVDAGRDFNQHAERLIRSMDFILTKKAKAATSAPATSTIDKPFAAPPPEPVNVPPPPPKAPEMPYVAPAAPIAAAPEPVRAAALPGGSAAAPAPMPIHVPPSRAPWIVAAVAVLVAGGAIGATVLYLKAPAPVPKEEPPKTTTVPPVIQGGGTTTAVATGCKLDIPTTLADDFKVVDPGWALPAQIAYYVDGQLALNGLEGRISRVLYPPFRFKNATVCAQVKSPPLIRAMDGSANGGVMFWATDTSNFYVASIYPNGTYSIYRMASDAWAQVAPRTPFAGIKQGPNVINEIQVTTKDNVGTLFVNGAKVQEFRGQPPKDNSAIGLYGASSADERNEWRMLSVVVADSERPQQPRTTQKAPTPQVGPGCKPLKTVAFEDNFKVADPGWGVTSTSQAAYVDGQLALKPRADKVWEQFYPSLFFKSATVCTHIKSPLQMTDLEGTANGGLVFWGINRTNYYTVDIFPNGRIGIYRMFNEQWAKVLPAVKSPAVKSGLGATNELMVSYGGDMAAFYVNGQKVMEFRGQPPANGGSIGLFAGSEAGAENEWRFTDVVVVEND
jgi:hypothetical protein